MWKDHKHLKTSLDAEAMWLYMLLVRAVIGSFV